MTTYAWQTSPLIKRRLFNIDEYHLLGEVGILGPEEHVELLEGIIYTMQPPAIRRFTVDEYHHMADAGILREDERVELIDGEVVQLTPIGSAHAACIIVLDEILHDLLGKRVHISVQSPFHLSANQEPQPDVALLRRRPDFYRRRLPTAEDVLLLIEVSDRALQYDRTVKSLLCARANVQALLIVDLQHSIVEVYSEPGPQGYANAAVVERGEMLSLPGFADVNLPVDELFG